MEQGISTAHHTASHGLSLLHEAFNLSSDGVIVYEAVRDADGRIHDYILIELNDAATDIFGMKREDVTGKAITALWPGIEHDDVWPHCMDVVETRRPYHTEVHRTTPAGHSLWFDVTLRPYRDGFANSYRDITAHKHALHYSEAQKEFYEDLVQQSASRISVLAPVYNDEGGIENFRYDYANYGHGIDDGHRHLPVQDKNLIGMLSTDVVPSVKSSPLWDFYIGIAATGIAARTEVHYKADGLDVLTEVAGKRLADGRILMSYADISASRKLASELAAEKLMLDGVFETVPLGLTVFEAVRNEQGILKDLRLLRRNEKALAFSRIPRDIYKPNALISDLMPKELYEHFEKMLDVVRTGEPLLHELYQPHNDIWISSRVMKHGDGLLSTIEDITEQKKTSQQIAESARLLNAVLDTSPIAIVVYEAVRDGQNTIEDFRPIIVNKHALEISGFTSEEFLDKTFFQRTPGSRGLLASLTAVITEKKQERFEHQVPSTGRWVNSITTPFGDGFIATSQDITEYKEQTRIIEEQATLFNGVLRSLQNGLSILRIIRDDAGDMVDVEYIEIADSVERDTGLSRAETRGRSMRGMFPGIEQTDYWQAYTTVARTGEPVSFETHFTLQGYDNYLLNWVTPIGTDMLVSVYYIVNDLKLAQRELEHSIHELRRSNADLEQFASIASHDLQEPLRKVQSFGTMLETRYAEALGEEGKDLVRRMQSAAGRMRNLVTGLLAFARLSGDEHLLMVPIDLNGLIADIVADLDQALRSSHGTITVAGRMPFVQGIDGQLRHLFQNLLTNALKFCRPDVPSVISISAQPLAAEDHRRLSPMAAPEQYVRINVEDNGIGFEPEYSEKIFGLFERLHGMSKYQGTGIGLSICRRVADRHEGTIWAEGRPGAGATFSVLLLKAEAKHR